MAKSTGPILVAGALTWANDTFFEKEANFDFSESVRVALGTGIAAGMLVLLEKPMPDLAVILSWTALATVLLVPIPGRKNSPLTAMFQALGF